MIVSHAINETSRQIAMPIENSARHFGGPSKHDRDSLPSAQHLLLIRVFTQHDYRKGKGNPWPRLLLVRSAIFLSTLPIRPLSRGYTAWYWTEVPVREATAP